MTRIPAAQAFDLIAHRRAEIERRLAGTAARLDAVRSARSDWTDEEHDPEGFALTHEWSTAEGSRAALVAEMRELDLAEARVRAGTYGLCERCGLPIPVEQLQRRPARRDHVRCPDRAADGYQA